MTMNRAKTLFFCVWGIKLHFTQFPNWLYLGLIGSRNSCIRESQIFQARKLDCCLLPFWHYFGDFYINNECSLIFCHVLPSIYISDSQVDYLEILDKVSASLESSTSPCDWSVGFKIPEGGCLHFLFSMRSKMTCLQVLWGRPPLFLY